MLIVIHIASMPYINNNATIILTPIILING
ncbi:uncharacterized protein METZ01_LOCUS291637 [marine metagenome]|uniref:Uncharacterized protein n=1 Tax=marine metagenome TaxID=408172 RepID=A0A382LQV6_9ZZZZ